MDTGSTIIVCLIVVWGALEYHRRERSHKALLDALEQGRTLGAHRNSPRAATIVGEALVAILLGATSTLMIHAASRGADASLLLYGMGTLFVAMTLVVALMLLRDARRRRRSSRVSHGDQP